ncbi:MAG TPA: glucosidase, partial [Thermoanaerobaculia bacterium]
MTAPSGGAWPEVKRLDEDASRRRNWKRWGPYLAERQWGTVREDYSEFGTAWDYFPHEHARSRTYRWGEDGLLGLCDREGRLCFALALWNGRDPILKERLFGLSGPEGNHGEDVKESYFYLDSTPTHSYMRALYKYPQSEFPYARLIEENHARSRNDPEFELADTGVFEDSRYFDVFAEYAKAGPDDILIRITVANRG